MSVDEKRTRSIIRRLFKKDLGQNCTHLAYPADSTSALEIHESVASVIIRVSGVMAQLSLSKRKDFIFVRHGDTSVCISTEDLVSINHLGCNTLRFNIYNQKNNNLMIRKRRMLDIIFCKEEQLDFWMELCEEIFFDQKMRSDKLLKVMVNPFGGKRNGKKIFKKYLEPLLCESGRNYEVTITNRCGQIKEFCRTIDTNTYEQVCVIGGDGTLGEAINGLWEHENREVLKKVIISTIPAGSTNSLCKFRGISNPLTASFYVIKGPCIQRPLDCLSVKMLKNDATTEVLSTCAVSFGFISQVNEHSRHWRVFGPARYGLCGARVICCNRKVLKQQAEIKIKVLKNRENMASSEEQEVEEWDYIDADALGSWDISSPEMWVNVLDKCQYPPPDLMRCPYIESKLVDVSKEQKVASSSGSRHMVLCTQKSKSQLLKFLSYFGKHDCESALKHPQFDIKCGFQEICVKPSFNIYTPRRKRLPFSVDGEVHLADYVHVKLLPSLFNMAGPMHGDYSRGLDVERESDRV